MFLDGLLYGGMVACLALLSFLVFYGGRRLSRLGTGAYDDSVFAGPWPGVGLVVPIAGTPKDIQETLQTLVRQSHPDYEVVFVTQDAHDTAVPVINDLLAWAKEHAASGCVRVRHVYGGEATQCGQKNQNLLAGIKALGADREILVFCDCSHPAPENWLQQLVTPISQGRAKVSTGYHHCYEQGPELPAFCKKITVLALYLMQEIPLITQPWGGSTAISRSVFLEWNVEGRWARNVVDDVSLAALLVENNERVVPVVSSCLRTNVAEERYGTWLTWFSRQWLYLKYIFPGSWVGVGLFLYFLTFLLLFSAFRLFFGPANIISVLFFVLLGVLGHFSRSCHPQPGSWWKWQAGFLSVLFLAGWSHFTTIFIRGLQWGPIHYQVRRGGEVVTLKRDTPHGV